MAIHIDRAGIVSSVCLVLPLTWRGFSCDDNRCCPINDFVASRNASFQTAAKEATSQPSTRQSCIGYYLSQPLKRFMLRFVSAGISIQMHP